MKNLILGVEIIWFVYYLRNDKRRKTSYQQSKTSGLKTLHWAWLFYKNYGVWEYLECSYERYHILKFPSNFCSFIISVIPPYPGNNFAALLLRIRIDQLIKSVYLYV